MDGGLRPLTDRRLAPRQTPPPALCRPRLRSGYDARVVDLSVSGALLETVCRLLPGGFVELRFASGDDALVARARVMRASVLHLSADRVVYAGGIRFTSPLRERPRDGPHDGRHG